MDAIVRVIKGLCGRWSEEGTEGCLVVVRSENGGVMVLLRRGKGGVCRGSKKGELWDVWRW